MQQNPRIKVHTSIAPSNEAVKTDKKIRWRVLPQARGQSAQRKRIARRARAAQRTRTRHTLSERLLRNTAVACALILVAMAITSIDAPWSQKAADGIRQALTMNVELDEQIGGLQFVQRLMPESALVFWNLESGAQTPVAGEIAHEYSAQQPWREYATETDAPVRATMDGIVAAVGENASGEWTAMVNHADGLQTIYAFMAEADVRVGEELLAGAIVGRSSGRLYFEARSDGAAIDPGEVLSQ